MQRSIRTKVTAGAIALVMGVAAVTGTASATHSFPDVATNTYYHDAVDWLETQGITDGMGDTGNYEPFTIVNRAQMAVFLWRMAGKPAPESMEHGFDDVDEGSWYEEAVAWLKETRITTGVGGGFADSPESKEFQPWEPVLRSQMITFLWRYGGRAIQDDGGTPYPPHGFDDVPPGTFYERALSWAKAESITTGTGGTLGNPSDTFEPTGQTTRAQMAALLWRFADFPAADEWGDTRCPGDWGPDNPDPNNECPPVENGGNGNGGNGDGGGG
jgi:hypothetical protein